MLQQTSTELLVVVDIVWRRHCCKSLCGRECNWITSYILWTDWVHLTTCKMHLMKIIRVKSQSSQSCSDLLVCELTDYHFHQSYKTQWFGITFQCSNLPDCRASTNVNSTKLYCLVIWYNFTYNHYLQTGVEPVISWSLSAILSDTETANPGISNYWHMYRVGQLKWSHLHFAGNIW